MASGGDIEHHYGVLLKTSMAGTTDPLYQQIPPTTGLTIINRVCAKHVQTFSPHHYSQNNTE